MVFKNLRRNEVFDVHLHDSMWKPFGNVLLTMSKKYRVEEEYLN